MYDAEEGGYWAEVLDLPGCVAQGETIQELQEALLEAIAAWEETSRESDGDASPRPVHTISILAEEPGGGLVPA
ncbi:MAG: type II toxin-antitoxin system HicB family antitoxin [Dehalococcoidia bacterium]